MSDKVFYDSAFFERHEPGSISSARQVVPIVNALLQPTSVVDVGCGLATWLSMFIELGVKDIVGVDGDCVQQAKLRIPSDRFITADLTIPLRLPRCFDLAVCLEVAEHLASDLAKQFVESLTLLAPCILFSAAIPFQGGTGHVNEQWQDYWADLFAEHEFLAIDCIRPAIWNDENVEFWYAQNTILYIHQAEAVRRALPTSPELPLRLVHPTAYLAWAARSPNLGEIVTSLPGTLKASVRHRLGKQGDSASNAVPARR